MFKIQQIAVIGTGAVGGYYGGLLQQAGFDLHFLLNRDYEQVRQNGLFIESPQGDIQLPKVQAYSDPTQLPPCDLTLIALKTTENHLLPDLLSHSVSSTGLVLTLQNGLGAEQAVAESVGNDRVLGGLCFLCANKVAPGHIRHLDHGLITLGEFREDGRPGGITPRLKQVGDTLQSAGIPIQIIDDLPLARWKKLVWNIPFNGLAVVKNALTNQLLADPKTRSLCHTLMHEVAAASAVCARPIPASFIEKMIDYTERMKPYAPSMKLDFDRGRPLETESIYGQPLRAAQAKGLRMPETEKLYHQLLQMDSLV